MKKDILRHEGDNLGGVNSFRFLEIEGVQEMPETFKGAIHTEITLNDGYRWQDGYCTEETMDFQEDQADGDHGASFKRVFVGQTPKDRPELTDLFEYMKNRRYILELTYNNGSKKIAGSPAEPMYFRTKLKTQKQMAGRNEHDIAFTGECVKKSPFYSI